jgi:hypothetical protein
VFIIFLVNKLTLFYFKYILFRLGGILIGGQTTDTAVWFLLGAICVHMSLITFSITLRLLIDNKNYIEVFIAMLIWSIMGSIGVFVSLLVTINSSGFSLINGVLQCLSAGTFVYITFIHMVYDDLTKTRFYPFVNIILIFIGFSIMILTSLWHEHP